MTITDATPADITAIYHHSPVPVALLRRGMALLVNGEWHQVDGAYWHQETGRYRLRLISGGTVITEAYTPDQEVWAYPDAQRIADLACTLAETAGPSAELAALEGSGQDA